MMQDLISQIVRKLIAEGLTVEKFTKEQGLKICQNCVGIVSIRYAFENFESDIKKSFITEIKNLNKLF